MTLRPLGPLSAKDERTHKHQRVVIEDNLVTLAYYQCLRVLGSCFCSMPSFAAKTRIDSTIKSTLFG